MLSTILILCLISSPVVISQDTLVVTREDDVGNEINYDSVNATHVESFFLDDGESTLNLQRQAVLNRLVDKAIEKFVKQLSETNRGKFALPNLNNDFSTGSSAWKVKGKFSALNGTFEDLATLKRTDDVVLKKNGKKLTVSSAVGLSRIFAEYKKYKLKYGIVKVSGKLSGKISTLAVSVKASIDYAAKPCTSTIDEIKVTDFGEVKVEITGLGALNKLMSKLVDSVTHKWRGDIVQKIEERLMKSALENLHKFDCEKYRAFG